MPSRLATVSNSAGRRSRVTPSKRQARVTASGKSQERWDPNQSRSVQSGWIWRGFLMLSLLAVGVIIIMAGNHHTTLAILWAVIAAGWFAISMWLWRKHKSAY
jgi:Flp pilus assembly protein TadB